MTILRDIACGLTYLHEKNDLVKKSTMLHGSLQPECVLIEINGEGDQIVAKLFDFTNSLELNESENFDSKIRDEFYRFGQV